MYNNNQSVDDAIGGASDGVPENKDVSDINGASAENGPEKNEAKPAQDGVSGDDAVKNEAAADGAINDDAKINDDKKINDDAEKAVPENAVPECDAPQNGGVINEPAESKAADIGVKIEIIGVRFKKSGKIYYFDPDGIKAEEGAHVIVETARGIEYGTVAVPNRMIKEEQAVLPLRKTLRIATSEDEEHRAENAKKEIEAFNICIEKIETHRLPMKLIDVEYTFDNNKLLFYFTADGRIDFRELVKDLAAVFRTRIELRQIGIRDEAKMMGGLGICGRPFCCNSFLSDFMQVSIKMAKEQNLSLNLSKISGACGRLMCCLRYEYDNYDTELKKLPKTDSVVMTPDGEGVVIEVNPLAGLLKVRLNANPELPPKVYRSGDVTSVTGYIQNDGEQETAEDELKGLDQDE